MLSLSNRKGVLWRRPIYRKFELVFVLVFVSFRIVFTICIRPRKQASLSAKKKKKRFPQPNIAYKVNRYVKFGQLSLVLTQRQRQQQQPAKRSETGSNRTRQCKVWCVYLVGQASFITHALPAMPITPFGMAVNIGQPRALIAERQQQSNGSAKFRACENHV